VICLGKNIVSIEKFDVERKDFFKINSKELVAFLHSVATGQIVILKLQTGPLECLSVWFYRKPKYEGTSHIDVGPQDKSEKSVSLRS